LSLSCSPPYGFGLFTSTVRKNKALGHGGGIFGFISALTYLPGPDVSVVVLENDDQDNDNIGGDSADTFARRLAAKALGDPYPDRRGALSQAPAIDVYEHITGHPPSGFLVLSLNDRNRADCVEKLRRAFRQATFKPTDRR
jgi:hypothetical protein